MINFVDKIVEIDKEASEKVESAEKEAQEIRERAHAELSEMKVYYDERIRKKLDQVRAEYGKFADEDIHAAEAKNSVKTKNLLEIFENAKSGYAKNILSAMTGGHLSD